MTTPTPPPKWATLLTPKESGEGEPFSFTDEEAYVRTRCYHEASRALDRAWEHTLEDASSKIHLALMKDCDNTEQRESGLPLRKRRRAQESQHNQREGDPPVHESRPANGSNAAMFRGRFALRTDPIMPPKMLPVYLLTGPSSPLDRLAWMRTLVAIAKRDSKGAVVWLQQQGSGVQPWATEMLRQLLVLDQAVGQSKIKQLSAAEALQVWCRSTSRFQHIQVYLDVQAISSTSSAPVHRLLHWMAHLRSNYGVPLSVVVLESSGVRRDDLCSFEQGSDGIYLQRHVLPTPKHVLTRLLSDRLIFDILPVLLDERTDSYSHSSNFWSTFTTTGSVVQAVLLWKRRLGRYLSTAGSFLTLNWETWLVDERRRLHWMLHPQHVLDSCLLTGSVDVLPGWRQQAAVKRFMACLGWQLRFVVAYQCQGSASSDMWTAIADHRPYLEVLARVRGEIVGKETGGLDERLEDSINELVVLLDNCRNLQEILQALDHYEEEWQQHLANLPLRVEIVGHGRQKASQPRRDLVDGLFGIPSRYESSDLVNVSGNLYVFLKHRVSIAFNDWLDLFMNANEIGDEAQAFALFCAAINFLKVQGLIRERRGAGRAESIFEKTAVVFSSGA
jgi:hypothetical protein